MAIGKETAEQKLLKMIESSSEDSNLSTKKSKKLSSSQSVLLIAKRSNKILFIGLVVAAVFLYNEFNKGAEYISSGIDVSKDSIVASKKTFGDNLVPTIQRVSYYMAGISSRNIFKPYEEPKMVSVVETASQQGTINDKIKDLKLVGISWMDKVSTASVMIEDTAKGVTYFLKKDEKLDDIVIKTIYAESVELGYENEEIIISYDKSQL